MYMYNINHTINNVHVHKLHVCINMYDINQHSYMGGGGRDGTLYIYYIHTILLLLLLLLFTFFSCVSRIFFSSCLSNTVLFSFYIYINKPAFHLYCNVVIF